MRIHFIAIGGAAMHQLAIALKLQGHNISGSDDEIFEPSRSNLKQHGIFPKQEGWDPTNIDNSIDAIILGMHARKDNPELAKALEIGLKVYSFPEYIYEASKDKLRVVIGGSHGKTTITAMIMHVLKMSGMDFDYLVGSAVSGFDVMARLSESAKIMVIEGDEYLTSALDPRPKFHIYKPIIAVISGIAWDHINVFPDYRDYVNQFRIFTSLIPSTGSLIYCAEDRETTNLANEFTSKTHCTPYFALDGIQENNKSYLLFNGLKLPVKVFGRHNFQNMAAAIAVCRELGVSDESFYAAISSFEGAARRLECTHEMNDVSVFRDFAHAPSKVKATINAMKMRNNGRKLIAVLELHTYSSLKTDFIPQYAGSMDEADIAFVYYNPHAIALKKLENITHEQVLEGFDRNDLMVFSNSDELMTQMQKLFKPPFDLLLMSSGNFNGMDIEKLLSPIFTKR